MIGSVQEGFTTLSGHKKEDVYQYIENKHPKIPLELYNELSKTKMTEVEVNISNINSEISSNQIVTLKFDPKKINSEIASAIKSYTWSVAGRLTFDEILYFGYRILNSYNLATHLIRCEFPYLLIDEYQDTNPLQNKIIKLISKKECIVAVVGDVAQSIYSFQGATYKEFQNFTLNSNLPVREYVIKGNRRSTRNIIDFINYLRKEDLELNDQTCELNLDSNQKITFILQKDRHSIAVALENIVGSDYVVLCRKWSEVFKYISNIDEEQKKLLNDITNAYSFQFRRNLETEIQAKRESWIESMIAIVELEDAFARKCIPSALETLDKYLHITALLHKFNEDNNKLLKKVIDLWEYICKCIRETLLLKDLIPKINSMMTTSDLPIKSLFRYPVEGDEDYFEGLYKLINKLEYTTAKEIVKEIFSQDGKYMTIHKAKGAEFDNVLINIEPAARLDSRDLDPIEIICNPIIFKDTRIDSEKADQEFTRIVYVAASRAKNKLYIHLYGDDRTAAKIDHVLEQYCKYVEKDKFYEFVYC